MLCTNSYQKKYIDDCRSTIDARVSAYQELVSTARTLAGAGRARLDRAIETFEPVFFGDLVFVLDGYFVHRSRTLEGKDGNPLNEVRVLCDSMTSGGGTLVPSKTIKLTPTTSVLGLRAGDEIKLSEGDFARLAEAYFDAIEDTYAIEDAYLAAGASPGPEHGEGPE